MSQESPFSQHKLLVDYPSVPFDELVRGEAEAIATLKVCLEERGWATLQLNGRQSANR